MARQITATAFEEQYCRERMGMSAETFRELGYRILPCNCGEDDCSGWRPSHPQADLADAVGVAAHSLNHIAGFLGSLQQTLGAIAMKYAPEEFTRGLQEGIERARARIFGNKVQ